MRTFWSPFDVSKGKRFCIECPNAHILGLFLIAREMETKFDIIHKANCS